MKSDQAVVISLQALQWLVADEGRIGAFLSQAGMVPAELAERASDPELLAALVDFILADEDSVLAFAHDAHLKPETLMQVRMALPGGQIPHWT